MYNVSKVSNEGTVIIIWWSISEVGTVKDCYVLFL